MPPYYAPDDADDADDADSVPEPNGGPSARKKRVPRKVSETYLERAAHHHLSRYGSSAENLRQVLRRKVQRSRAHHGGEGDGDDGLIQNVLDRLVAQGLLDDRRYAQALMQRLRRRGGSRRQIAARMQAKGISADVCRELLADEAAKAGGFDEIDNLDDGPHDVEGVAARTYARRRRLGPYRSNSSQRQERRERDLAAMARAGFDYGTATRTIDAHHPDEADEEVRPASRRTSLDHS